MMLLEVVVKKAKGKPRAVTKLEPEPVVPLKPWPAGTTVDSIPSDRPF